MFSSKEPFTYIDRVQEDAAAFKEFCRSQEEQQQDALRAVQNMKLHPWFGEFCAAVGVKPEQWGLETGSPREELLLFEEWLAAAQKDALVFLVARIWHIDLPSCNVCGS